MTSVQPGPAYPPQPYPPPPNYQPASAPASGNTMLVLTQPQGGANVMPGGTCPYRQMPCQVQCQFCGAVVVTSTQYTVGTFSWVVGLVICLVGCYLGCCLIPCCVDSCKDVIHTCPNCHNVVGRYNRL